LTSSLLARPTGSRVPRLASTPPFFACSLGGDAVDLAEHAGLRLDPWQADVLRDSLNQRQGWNWAAFEVGLIVPRQNGKGAIIEARQLTSLFLSRDAQSIYSAHQFKTSKTMFRRIKKLVKQTPDLHKLTGGTHDSAGKPVGGMYRQSNEETGIELLTGERLNFLARAGGSGRGFTGNTMIFDEAYDLDPDMIADLLPTLSAVKNAQVWYVSSAGMEASQQLAAIRARGMAGNEPRLMFREWSAPADADTDDEAELLGSNPGIECDRLDLEYIKLVERPGMTEDRYRRERLGIWRPPDAGDEIVTHLLAAWPDAADTRSSANDPLAFAIDVSPDRSSATIGMAGRRLDNHKHVEVIQSGMGTAWVVPRLVELVARWRPSAVVVDSGSSAGSLLPALRERGLDPLLASTRDVGQAFGAFYDELTSGQLHHLDQEGLTAALAGASTRPLGDANTWDRKHHATDITPLVAVTLASWGFDVKQSELLDVSACVW